MTPSDDDQPQAEPESVFDRLKTMREALDEAEQKLFDDQNLGTNELERELARINRAHAEIDLEEGRRNDAALAARDADPEVQRLVRDLGDAYDEFVEARRTMQRATARAQEAVAVIGKVDQLLKVFGGLALKLA